MLKITVLNVNGIRSAARKGFFDWLQRHKPDVVCLQEIKAHESVLTEDLRQPKGYFGYFHDAQKKGYSGVAIYSRREPDNVVMGLGWPDIDGEGRFIQADFGKLSVVSLYVPSGSSSELRQAVKFDFMARFEEVLKKFRRQRRQFIICGDWNIAHKAIDLKNWRGNQKNSGFLPDERAWMDKLFGAGGFVDAFRVVNPAPEQYTWWSNRGQAWAKNVGWRIDYQVISPGLADKVVRAEIYKDERFSDHAPLTILYDLTL